MGGGDIGIGLSIKSEKPFSREIPREINIAYVLETAYLVCQQFTSSNIYEQPLYPTEKSDHRPILSDNWMRQLGLSGSYSIPPSLICSIY
jgi:hypothetical protein